MFQNEKVTLRKLPGENLDLDAVQSLISLLGAQHEEGLFLAPAGLAMFTAIALFSHPCLTQPLSWSLSLEGKVFVVGDV